MTTFPPRSPRPSSRLVPHEIQLTRKPSESGTSPVVATIHCERRDCTLNVETCGYCERFARIETHEAGYVMLCRSKDEEEPDEPPR
jgi:hypothetical protein